MIYAVVKIEDNEHIIKPMKINVYNKISYYFIDKSAAVQYSFIYILKSLFCIYYSI